MHYRLTHNIILLFLIVGILVDLPSFFLHQMASMDTCRPKTKIIEPIHDIRNSSAYVRQWRLQSHDVAAYLLAKRD